MKAESLFRLALTGILLMTPVVGVAQPAAGAADGAVASKSSQPAQSDTQRDENQKLVALNALLLQNEPQALTGIREILKSDSSERLKECAVFILARGKSLQAKELLSQVAQNKFHSTPAVLAEAGTILQKNAPGLQQRPKAIEDRALTLDVEVTDKDGKPVSGLKADDFKILDNQQPQSLISFHAANDASIDADPPTQLILVIDGVNTFGGASETLRAFLLENSGQLALPTSLFFLTVESASLQNAPTRDGKALLKALDKIPARVPRMDIIDRRDHSLQGLYAVAVAESKVPGRKLLIWIGPGWASFINEDQWRKRKDDEKVFSDIVRYSTTLRQARMSVYSIDQRGIGLRPDDYRYKNFLDPVSTPKQAQFGNLDLQVLAMQTGGKVIFDSNDMTNMIHRCMDDARNAYVLRFNPPAATHADEYHSLTVEIDKPGLIAHTRTGYYAQP